MAISAGISRKTVNGKISPVRPLSAAISRPSISAAVRAQTLNAAVAPAPVLQGSIAPATVKYVPVVDPDAVARRRGIQVIPWRYFLQWASLKYFNADDEPKNLRELCYLLSGAFAGYYDIALEPFRGGAHVLSTEDPEHFVAQPDDWAPVILYDRTPGRGLGTEYAKHAQLGNLAGALNQGYGHDVVIPDYSGRNTLADSPRSRIEIPLLARIGGIGTDEREQGIWACNLAYPYPDFPDIGGAAAITGQSNARTEITLDVTVREDDGDCGTLTHVMGGGENSPVVWPDVFNRNFCGLLAVDPANPGDLGDAPGEIYIEYDGLPGEIAGFYIVFGESEAMCFPLVSYLIP